MSSLSLLPSLSMAGDIIIVPHLIITLASLQLSQDLLQMWLFGHLISDGSPFAV